MISRLPRGSRKEFLEKKIHRVFAKSGCASFPSFVIVIGNLGQRPALVSKSLLKFPCWRFERGKSVGLVSLFVPGPAAGVYRWFSEPAITLLRDLPAAGLVLVVLVFGFSGLSAV